MSEDRGPGDRAPSGSKPGIRRPEPIGALCEPAYPSLRVHVATRRRFLVWGGASLAGAALWGRCLVGPGKYAGDPAYYAYRIPLSGELTVRLSQGGTVSFYLVLTCETEEGFDDLCQTDAQDAACEVLAAHTFQELSEDLYDTLLYELESALLERFERLSCCATGALGIPVLTIVSLTPPKTPHGVFPAP